MSKKENFLKIIKTDLHKDKILVAMWPEADGNSGYLIRQDGEFLGIADYQNDDANIESLDQRELGKIATHAVNLTEFLKESGWQIQANQIKWLYEIEENKNFLINEQKYSFNQHTKTGDFHYSGMNQQSYKQTFKLNEDIFYIDDMGQQLEVKSGSSILGCVNDNDKNNIFVYFYVKDGWCVEIKAEYTDYKHSKVLNASSLQSRTHKCKQ